MGCCRPGGKCASSSATPMHVYQVCFSPRRQARTSPAAKTYRAAVGCGDRPNPARLHRLTPKEIVRRRVLTRRQACTCTASDDKTARLWDVATGQELRTFTGHTDRVSRAWRSRPMASQVLTGSCGQAARLWDAQTGQQLRQFFGHTSGVRRLPSRPTANRLSGSDDGKVRLWDAGLNRAAHTSSVPRRWTS